MKRSEINRSIELAKKIFKKYNIHLPPFAYWTVEELDKKGHETDEIRDCMLGWDVTDFGSGDFKSVGRIVFTLRNGCARIPKYRKVYAEKVLLLPELQRSPAHYHASKMEDIINRCGGNIIIQLYKATPDGKRSNEKFTVQVDGQTVEMEAGGKLWLRPGQSICLEQRTIHQFWSEEGTGYTISGEVSSVNDDWTDNYFLEPMVRFPKIEEDEPCIHYLCHEYPKPRT